MVFFYLEIISLTSIVVDGWDSSSWLISFDPSQNSDM